MIGYTTVGTNDLEAATAFYDGLLVIEGFKQTRPSAKVRQWIKPDAPIFGIAIPYDGQPATSGNGTMISLVVADQDQLKAMHSRALALGATNEGDAAPRGQGDFCGAYFRDLDGNKLAIFCKVDS